MSAVAFDTLNFVERLEAAGMPREQAAAIVQAQKDSFAEVLDASFATKADVARVESRLDVMSKDMGIRFAEMNGKFTLLQWMLGALLAVNIAVMLKLWV